MDATTGSRKGIAPAVAFLVSNNASFKSNASSANYSIRSHFTRRVLLLEPNVARCNNDRCGCKRPAGNGI